MRVTIFGGNRFVGRRVAALLVDAGAKVTVVHRSAPSTPGVRTIRGERGDRSVLDQVFEANPEAILDMSLYNAADARSLIRALDARPIRYLAVSSAAIYSQTAPLPWTEQTTIDPAPGWGRYGIEKAEADAVIRSAPLSDALVVRPPYVIGRGDPDERCERVFGRLEQGLPLLLPGDGSASIQVLDADDLAVILVALLNGEGTGVIDIPGAEPLTVRRFDECCAAAMGLDVKFSSVRDGALEYRPDRWPFPNLSLWVSGERFRQTVPLRPRSVPEILRQVLLDRRG
jgi:nucleoside-diphosphate-sugar epimerase